MNADKKLLTVVTVNYNTSGFIKLMLFALKALTKNRYKVIICDNGSNLWDRMQLKNIARVYDNVELIFKKQALTKGMAHGEALNCLLSLIETPIGVVLDSDATFLKKDWDDILIANLDGGVKVIGAPPLGGSMKKTDFPSVYAVLFDMAVFKSLKIDMRPKNYINGEDTGYEMRGKFIQGGYKSKLFEAKSTRIYKGGPFKDVICAEYYFQNTENIFASHFGRGASLGAAKYASGHGLLGANGIAVAARTVKGFIEKRNWISISKEIIIKETDIST